MISQTSLRAELAAAWRALLALPRALHLSVMAWWLKARLRGRVAKQDPALDAQLRKAGKQLDAVRGADLVRCFCLVDKRGKKLEVDGAPGKVALFLTVSHARAQRRPGETVQPVLVPATALGATARRGHVTTRLLHPVLFALLAGCAADGSPTAPSPIATTAPESPATPAESLSGETASSPDTGLPRTPLLIVCTGLQRDTLWIGRRPLVEELITCVSADTIWSPATPGRAL